MKDGSAFALTVRIVTPAQGGGWRDNVGVPFNLTYTDVMKRVAAVLEADGLSAMITPADVWSVVPGVITEPAGAEDGPIPRCSDGSWLHDFGDEPSCRTCGWKIAL